MVAAPSAGRASHVEAPSSGEAERTSALYDTYGDQIFRYCLHKLGTREEAEDATQTTFMNAFRGLSRGVVPEVEAAWLFKIAHNVCLSRGRSTRRRGRVESTVDFSLIAQYTQAPPQGGDELLGIREVLESLPESQRRAILLREWQGLTYREIAADLGISQSAVETLIFRARRSLVQALDPPAGRERSRAKRALHIGNALAGLKSFALGSGLYGKLIALLAVAGATTVVATHPSIVRHLHVGAPRPQHTLGGASAPSSSHRPGTRAPRHSASAPSPPVRHGRTQTLPAIGAPNGRAAVPAPEETAPAVPAASPDPAPAQVVPAPAGAPPADQPAATPPAATPPPPASDESPGAQNDQGRPQSGSNGNQDNADHGRKDAPPPTAGPKSPKGQGVGVPGMPGGPGASGPPVAPAVPT